MTIEELTIMNMESYIQGIKDTSSAFKETVDFSIAEMERKINQIKEKKNDN